METIQKKKILEKGRIMWKQVLVVESDGRVGEGRELWIVISLIMLKKPYGDLLFYQLPKHAYFYKNFFTQGIMLIPETIVYQIKNTMLV